MHVDEMRSMQDAPRHFDAMQEVVGQGLSESCPRRQGQRLRRLCFHLRGGPRHMVSNVEGAVNHAARVRWRAFSAQQLTAMCARPNTACLLSHALLDGWNFSHNKRFTAA